VRRILIGSADFLPPAACQVPDRGSDLIAAGRLGALVAARQGTGTPGIVSAVGPIFGKEAIA
jgi:hypothetical protein